MNSNHVVHKVTNTQSRAYFEQFIPFEHKYPPEWQNMNGEMVLVKNDISATWRAMENLVISGRKKSST